MEQFWKAVGLGLMALVLWVLTDRQQKDLGVMLNLAVCVMLVTAAAWYIKPMLDLVEQLNRLGNLQEGMLDILVKAVGIGFVAETAGTVCKDGGNATLAQLLRTLGSTAIVYVSLPVFGRLLELLQEILGML